MIKLVARGAGGLGLAAVLWLAACSSASDAAQDRRYYVNYEKGSDSNSGLAPDNAWQHAPGDLEAAGRPAGVRLSAGDHVVFAPGVSYRGEIHVRGQGTKERPIVFEGGEGNAAIIDGSNPVSFTPCESAARCGDHPDWEKLVRVTLDAPLGRGSLFSDSYAGDSLLYAARTPNPVTPFYRHMVADMLTTSFKELESGTLQLPPGLAGVRLAEGAHVILWVMPNVVARRPITAITGDKLHFDPAKLRFYPSRPGKYSIVGLAESLDQPGEYFELPGGRELVALLPAGVRTLSVARGRSGIVLEGQAAHVTVRNLTFRHMGDNGRLYGGRAVSGWKGGEGVVITGNRFLDMDMARRQAAITLRKMKDVVITGNRIENMAQGSGISLGSDSNVRVERNRLYRIGRIGVFMMNVKDALVADNLIVDVRGVHGNAISAYLDNQRIRIIGNTVMDADRPLTFHGTKKGMAEGMSNDFEFRDNLLVTTARLGSLVAWGKTTRGVKISGNILLGGRFGLRISSRNEQFSITGNAGVHPALFKGEPAGWQVQGNSWFAGEAPAWAREVVQASREAIRSGDVPGSFDCSSIPVPLTRVGATLACSR